MLALTAAMGIGLVGLASPAGAADANAAAKASCKGDGWKTQFRADGPGFKNQGDCVAYAARGGAFALQCHDSANPGYLDIQLTAAINTQANGVGFGSTNGTCNGAINRGTIVSANDQTSANAECQTLNSGVGRNAQSLGYSTTPSDWFLCTTAFPL